MTTPDRDFVTRTLPQVLKASVMKYPDHPAVIVGGVHYSYEDIWMRAKRAACALRDLGVAPEEPVLVMLPNAIEFIDIWIGLSLLGAIEVPVNTELVGEILRHQITSSRARIMIAYSTFHQTIIDALDYNERPTVVIVGQSDETGEAPSWHDFEREYAGDTILKRIKISAATEHQTTAIMYTSGTTGAAKGVEISHVHSFTYAGAVARLLELAPGDRYFAPLPLFHIAGQWALVYACLQAGATAIITERFSVKSYWDTVRQHNVRSSFLLGAMANMLYHQGEEPTDADNPLQRVLMVPLVDDIEGFRQRFGVAVCTCYGSTESNVPIVAGYDVTDPRMAGRAAAGYSLRIADANDYEVPTEKVGELLVRSDEPWQIATAYHAGGSPETFRNFWLHTGDAFRQDAAGNYYFVDRVRDYIRRRGENISSADIEREVNAFHSVLESAAVGYPSEVGEDDVAVFVVPREGAKIVVEDLRGFLTSRIPRFMWPDRIELTDELPKTPTGKIRKQALRERLPP